MNDKYIDQALNITSIRGFLLRRESIFLFLALTCAFTILLVVFGQPTSLTEYTEQLTRLSPLGQISITFTAGFFLLLVSRAMLYLVARNRQPQPLAIVVWAFSELVLCVSVMSLVLWAISGGGHVDLASLVGTLVLGQVGVLLMPAVVSYLIYRLHEDQQEIQRLRQTIATQGVSTAQQQDAVINFYAKSGKLAFSTKMSRLLYIEGADNYVNIHYINTDKEDTFILYNTLKNIEKTYSNTSLMRCHRCFMVNVENVRLMRKESTGLQLEMNQCQKVIPVSKSFAEPITRHFASNTNLSIPTEK